MRTAANFTSMAEELRLSILYDELMGKLRTTMKAVAMLCDAEAERRTPAPYVGKTLVEEPPLNKDVTQGRIVRKGNRTGNIVDFNDIAALVKYNEVNWTFGELLTDLIWVEPRHG